MNTGKRDIIFIFLFSLKIALIRSLMYFILMLPAFLFAQGQQQSKEVINARQKLLQRKPDETHEQVDSFHTLHLIIAGNVYQTERQVNYAYDRAESKYNFKGELKYIQPILNLGDITIANLKVSFGDDSSDIFSAPDEFALAMKYSGITAVMHANQHTANVHKATLVRTRDLLNEFGMYHTGAFADKFERDGNYPLIINKKGFRIAVLNYTYLPSRPEASREFFINEIDKSYIDKDMRMAFVYKPDFIIVYFNWGEDGQDIPTHMQQDLTQYVFNKGANLVVGACPNRPMRVDYLNYFYNRQEREGIVAYSLGNLVGSSEDLKNRNGYLMDMVLKKNEYTSNTHIDDWGIIPVYTYYDTTGSAGKTKVYSLPCWAVETGDIFKDIPYIEKRRVVNSAYEVRKMLGSTGDEIQYNMNELVVNNVAEVIQITNSSLNNKYSQTHERDIKPSAAPIAVNLIPGTNTPSSLAMVQSQTQVQPKFDAKTEKKKEKEIEKQTAYTEQRKKAEEAFNNTGVTPAPVTTATVSKNEKPDSASLPVTARDKSIAKVDSSFASTKSKDSTKYHTSGNTYNLNDQANRQPQKPAGEKAKSERPKENIVDASDYGQVAANTDIKPTLQPELEQQKGKESIVQEEAYYRIQFYALKKYMPLDTNYYTHLKGYEVAEEDGLYKYYLGHFKTYKECLDYWKSQIQPRYKESFIVKYVGGKRGLK